MKTSTMQASLCGEAGVEHKRTSSIRKELRTSMRSVLAGPESFFGSTRIALWIWSSFIRSMYSCSLAVPSFSSPTKNTINCTCSSELSATGRQVQERVIAKQIQV
jgi:hypothetical protein